MVVTITHDHDGAPPVLRADRRGLRAGGAARPQRARRRLSDLSQGAAASGSRRLSASPCRKRRSASPSSGRRSAHRQRQDVAAARQRRGTGRRGRPARRPPAAPRGRRGGARPGRAGERRDRPARTGRARRSSRQAGPRRPGRPRGTGPRPATWRMRSRPPAISDTAAAPASSSARARASAWPTGSAETRAPQRGHSSSRTQYVRRSQRGQATSEHRCHGRRAATRPPVAGARTRPGARTTAVGGRRGAARARRLLTASGAQLARPSSRRRRA